MDQIGMAMERRTSQIKRKAEQRYQIRSGEQRVRMRSTLKVIAPDVISKKIHYILRHDRGNGIEPPTAFDRKGLSVENPFEKATAWEKIAKSGSRVWILSVSPERGSELDLRDFVVKTFDRLEREMNRPIQFIAAVHQNTHHPHIHIVIPEIGVGGERVRYPFRQMVLGLLWCASKEATIRLGHEPEWLQKDIRKSISLPFWTSADNLIKNRLEPNRTFRIIQEKSSYNHHERFQNRVTLARLTWLVKNGMARKEGKEYRMSESWEENLLIPEQRRERFKNLVFGLEDGTVQTGAAFEKTRPVDLSRAVFSPMDRRSVTDDEEQRLRSLQVPLEGQTRLTGVTILDPDGRKTSRQVALVESRGKIAAIDLGAFNPGAVRPLVRELGRDIWITEENGRLSVKPVLDPELERKIDMSVFRGKIDPQIRMLYLWEQEEKLRMEKRQEHVLERERQGMNRERAIGLAAEALGYVLSRHSGQALFREIDRGPELEIER